MQTFSILGGGALFWFMVVIVPGVDFLLITRLAIQKGRVVALRACLGVAVGIALWGLAGFFGIRALFAASPWLYLFLKIGGGIYLIYVGINLVISSFKKSEEKEITETTKPKDKNVFISGVITNLANPKAPIFVSSLFATVLPSHASVTLGLSCVMIMFVVSIVWYSFVTMILSLPRINQLFLRFRNWVDRCSGLTFMTLGIHFATDRTTG